MKYILCFLFFLSSTAQAQITFQRLYGGDSSDQCLNAAFTIDEGLVMVGSTKSFGAGKEDVYLMKVDDSGTLQWAKAYGGSDIDIGQAVTQTSDGGYIITGYTKSFGDPDNDLYIVKTDDSGNMEWSGTFGGVGDDRGYQATETSDGGYCIVGFIGYKGCLIRLDHSGNLAWGKTYDNLSAASYIKSCPDNGFIIAGTNSPNIRFYLAKIDSSGNGVWGRFYDAYPGLYENLQRAEQTSDGGYILSGFTRDDVEWFIRVARTDSLGHLLWAKAYREYGNEYGATTAICQAADGGFLVAGSSFHPLHYFKIDGSGNVTWARHLKNNTGLPAFVQERNSQFILCGSNAYMAGDFLYAKTNSLGQTCNDSISAITNMNWPLVDTSAFIPIANPFTNSSVPSTIVASGGEDSIFCNAIIIPPDAVMEVLRSDFSISPNPSAGIFIISSNEKISSIEVSNSIGSKVYTAAVNASKTTVDISTEAAGVYFYTIYTGKRIERGKIILQ